MPLKVTIEDVQNQFALTGWSSTLIDGALLAQEDEYLIKQFIINQLSCQEPQKRYIASSMIIEFQIQEAKYKLIERILCSETENYNGSMTYALSHLNCKNELVKVFRILTTQSFESKMHAYAILSEQEFEFTEGDLNQIQQLWQYFSSDPEKHNVIDAYTVEMVRNVYEGFIAYM